MMEDVNVDMRHAMDVVGNGISKHSGKIAIGAMVIGVALLLIATLGSDTSTIHAFSNPIFDIGSSLILLSLVTIAIRACKKKEAHLGWAAIGTIVASFAIWMISLQCHGGMNMAKAMVNPLYDIGLGLLVSSVIMFIVRSCKKKNSETEQTEPQQKVRSRIQRRVHQPSTHQPQPVTTKLEKSEKSVTQRSVQPLEKQGPETLVIDGQHDQQIVLGKNKITFHDNKSRKCTMEIEGDTAKVTVPAGIRSIIIHPNQTTRSLGGPKFLFYNDQGNIALWNGQTIINQNDSSFYPALLNFV